ncbi:MAG: hypothetical protein NEHIOOID_00256 [Holosporales bacterium]
MKMKKIVSSVCILSIMNSTCFLSVLNATTETYGYKIYDNSGREQTCAGIKDYICADNVGNVSGNDSLNQVYSPFCALMTGDVGTDVYCSDLDVLVVTNNSTVTSNLLILGGEGGDGGDGDEERSRPPLITSMQALITLMEFMPLILTGFRFQKFMRHASKTGKSFSQTLEYFSKKATRVSMIKRMVTEVAKGNFITKKLKSFPKKVYAEVVDMLPKSLLTKHAKKMKRAFKAVSNLTDENDKMLQLLLKEGREVENKAKIRHAFAKYLQDNMDKLGAKGRSFEQTFNSRVFGKQSDMFRKSGEKLRPKGFQGGLVELMKKNLDDIAEASAKAVDDAIPLKNMSNAGSEILGEADTATMRSVDEDKLGKEVLDVGDNIKKSDLESRIKTNKADLESCKKEIERFKEIEKLKSQIKDAKIVIEKDGFDEIYCQNEINKINNQLLTTLDDHNRAHLNNVKLTWQNRISELTTAKQTISEANNKLLLMDGPASSLKLIKENAKKTELESIIKELEGELTEIKAVIDLKKYKLADKKVLSFADEVPDETFSDLVKASKVKDATDNAEDLLKKEVNELYVYHERLDYVEGIMESLSLQNFALKGYSLYKGKQAAKYLIEGVTMRTWPFVVVGVRRTLEKLTTRMLARTDSRGSVNLSKWTQNGFSEAFRAVRGAQRRDRFVAGENIFYGGGGGGGGFGWSPVTVSYGIVSGGIGSGGGGGGNSYRSMRTGSDYMTKSGGGGSGSYAAGGGGGGACYDTATAYWIFNKAGNGGSAAWFAGGGGGGASGTGSGLSDWPEGDGFGKDGANGSLSVSKGASDFKITLSGGGGGGGGMRAANMVLSILEMILEMYVEATVSAIPIIGAFYAPIVVMGVKAHYWAILLAHQGMSHATAASGPVAGRGGGYWFKPFQFPILTPFPLLDSDKNLAGNIHASRSVSNGLIGQLGGDGASGVVNNFLIKQNGSIKKKYELNAEPNNHAGFSSGSGQETVSSNAAGGGGGGGVDSPGGNAIQTWESGASGGGGGGAYPYEGGHNISDDGSAHGGGGWGGNGGSSDLFNIPVSSQMSIPLGALKGGAGGRGYCGGGGGNGGGWIVVKSGVILNLGRTKEQCVQTNILAQSNSPQIKAFMLYGAAAGSDGESQGGSGGNGGGVMVIDGTVNVNSGYSFIVTRPTPPLKSRGKSGGYVLINNGGTLCLNNTSKTSCDIELLNGGTLFVDKLALSYDMDDINDSDTSIQPTIPTLFGYHPTNKLPINIKLQGMLIYGLSQFNFNAVEVPDDYDRAYLFSVLSDDVDGIGKIPFKTWNICCDRDSDYIVPSFDVTSPLRISKKTQTAAYLSNCSKIKKVYVTKIQEPNNSNVHYGCLDLNGITFASDQSLSLQDGGTLIVPTTIPPGKITVNGGVLETGGTTLNGGVLATGTTTPSNFFSPFTISRDFAVKTTNVLADNDTGVSCSAIPQNKNVTWQVFGGTASAPQFGTTLGSSNFKFIEVYGYFKAAGMALKRNTSNVIVQNVIVKSGGIFDITNATISDYVSKITFETGAILIATNIPTGLEIRNCSLRLKEYTATSIPDVQSLQIAGSFMADLETTTSTEVVEGGLINISSIKRNGVVVVKERGQIRINSDYSITDLTALKDITVKDSGIVTYLGATTATATTTTQPIAVNDIFKYLKIQGGIFQTNVGVIDGSTGIGNPDIVETLNTWYINSGLYEQTALSANQFSTIRVLSGSTLNASGLIMEAGKNLVIDSGATLKLDASSKLTILGQLYLKNGAIITKGDGASIVIRPGATICSDKTDFLTAIAALTLSQGVVLHTTANVTNGFTSSTYPMPSEITAWYINSLSGKNLTSAIIAAMPKNIHVQVAVKITDTSDVNIPSGYSLFLNESSRVNFNSKKINIKSGAALFVSSTIDWSTIAANIAFESGSQFVTDVSNFSSFSSTSFSGVNKIGTTKVISDSTNGVSYPNLSASINTWNIYAPFSDSPQTAIRLSVNSKITTINIGVFDDGMSGQIQKYPGYLDATGLTLNRDQTLNVLRGGTLYIPNSWEKSKNGMLSVKLDGTINVKLGGIIAVDDISLARFFSLFNFDRGDEGAILQINSALPTDASLHTRFKKVLINYGSLSAPITLTEKNVSGLNEVLVAGPFNASNPGFISSSCVKSLFNNNKRTLTVMQGGVLCVSDISDLTLSDSSSKIKLKDSAIVNLDLPTTTGTTQTELAISGLSSKFTFETGDQILMTSKVVRSHEAAADNKFSIWMINAGTEAAPQTLVSDVNASSFSTIIVLNGSFLKWTGAQLTGDVSVIVKSGGTLLLAGADSWPVNVEMKPGSMVKQTDKTESNWYADFKKHVQNDVNTSGVVHSSVVNFVNRTVESNQAITIPTDYIWNDSGTISVEPNGIVETNATSFPDSSVLKHPKLTLQYGCILKTTSVLTDTLGDDANGVLKIPDTITQWHIATAETAQRLTSLTDTTTLQNKTNLRLIKVLNGAKLDVLNMIIPNDLTVEFDAGSTISQSGTSSYKLQVYGTLVLPASHTFSSITVKKGGVLRSDRTDFSSFPITFESGSILSTTSSVTAFSQSSSYIWNIEKTQVNFPIYAPTYISTSGLVSFASVGPSFTLRLNQGASLVNDITVYGSGTLFFDRYFDLLTLNKNITFEPNSILATNSKLINFRNNIIFASSTDNYIFQSHSLVNDDATGLGQIPCRTWQILAENKGFFVQTARTLNSNPKIKNIFIGKYAENGAVKRGFLNGTGLTLTDAQNINVEDGGVLYLPKMDLNDKAMIKGQITIKSGGSLVLNIDADWPTFIKLENDAKVLQDGKATSRPQWYEAFKIYINSQNNNSLNKIYLYMNYIDTNANSGSKVTKLLSPDIL